LQFFVDFLEVFSGVRSRLNNYFFVLLKKLAIIVVVGLCNIINLAITGRVIKKHTDLHHKS